MAHSLFITCYVRHVFIFNVARVDACVSKYEYKMILIKISGVNLKKKKKKKKICIRN